MIVAQTPLCAVVLTTASQSGERVLILFNYPGRERYCFGRQLRETGAMGSELALKVQPGQGGQCCCFCHHLGFWEGLLMCHIPTSLECWPDRSSTRTRTSSRSF
eukprot:741327-Hanusia_phi.AAC.4